MKPHVPFELAVPVGAIDHVTGAPHAVATVVEYGDFECPNCKQAQPAVKMLLERFTGRVRFAFRHFPLEEVHPHALSAAQAAECAGGQGKFWEMHDLLFADQGRLEDPHLWERAEQLELDLERFESDRRSEAVADRVRRDFNSGVRAGVVTTPTVFSAGRMLTGQIAARELEALQNPD